jgi:ectoine hydroxylase-related dioxygenase (phytanoyl-CoA dioxygenase family)
LTPQIHLHTAALIYKKPENPADARPLRDWHRDIGIQGDLGHAGLPRVGIKVCYCLTDFHERDSGMTLLARSSNQRQQALRIPAGARDPEERVDPILNAGDAIFFENRTFHSAAPNLGDRVSKVIIFGYAYRWMRPDINLDLLDQSAPWLSTLSDIDKQLLGVDGYHDLINPARPLVEWADSHGVNTVADHSEIEV